MPHESPSPLEAHPAVQAIDATIEALTQLRESGTKLVPVDASIWREFCTPVRAKVSPTPAPKSVTPATPTLQMPVVAPPSQAERVEHSPEVLKVSLELLQKDIHQCQSCPLSCEHHLPSLGTGYGPKVMVVNGAYMLGDRPEAIGSRLEGAAGEMLWKMLAAIHLTPEDTYLTHGIRCPVTGRPPRDALLRCSEWLRKEIKLIQPQVVILLGPFASATLFPHASTATTTVGRWSLFETIPCVTLHHPMRIQMLENLAQSMKMENWSALKAIQERLRSNEK